MSLNPSIFKSYDIRGIYPQDLNEETIKTIAKAIFTFLAKSRDRKELTIAVGRDMRVSSPSLYETAVSTLKEMGARVIELDLVSTPTFYFSVFNYGYDAGFVITASHNPSQWNGIKIVMKGEKGLIKIGKTTGMEDIKEIALSNVFSEPMEGGSAEKKEGILDDEIQNSLSIVKNPEIKKFKIVADVANAMGGQYISAIFEKIPVELIKMNFELDGTFPAHQADPLQSETLVDLQKKVVEEKADLGLAPDGDGDRLFFIDEKGQIVPPTIITSMVAKDLLRNNPGEKILFDIRYILTPEKIVEENGGSTDITKVGHAFITEALEKTGAIFAGESSAHYYFRDTGNTESQLTIILMVLKILTEANKPFSEVVEGYRRSYESGEINFKVDNAQEIIEKIKEKYSDGELNALDGIAISYPTWRFSLRTSNTEPLMRLNLEALEKEEMETKKEEMVELIESLK